MQDPLQMGIGSCSGELLLHSAMKTLRRNRLQANPPAARIAGFCTCQSQPETILKRHMGNAHRTFNLMCLRMTPAPSGSFVSNEKRNINSCRLLTCHRRRNDWLMHPSGTYQNRESSMQHRSIHDMMASGVKSHSWQASSRASSCE